MPAAPLYTSFVLVHENYAPQFQAEVNKYLAKGYGFVGGVSRDPDGNLFVGMALPAPGPAVDGVAAVSQFLVQLTPQHACEKRKSDDEALSAPGPAAKK